MKFLVLTTFVTLGAALVVPTHLAIDTSLTTTVEGSYDQEIVDTKAETTPRAAHSLTIAGSPPSVAPIETVTSVFDENWWRENGSPSGQNRLYARDVAKSNRKWVIAISIVLPLIFLAGLLESFYWFSRMMQGRSALRLGTVCWSVTFFGLFAIKRERKREIQQERMVARANWAATGLGGKLKLWLIWGFTWEYPVELLGPRESPGWVWARTNPSTNIAEGILLNDVAVGKSPQPVGKPVEITGNAYAV